MWAVMSDPHANEATAVAQSFHPLNFEFDDIGPPIEPSMPETTDAMPHCASSAFRECRGPNFGHCPGAEGWLVIRPEPRKIRQRPDECRELFAKLSEYLDGRVEPLTCEQMRSHIEACPSCVAFLRDLRSAIDRCRSLQLPRDPAITVRLLAILTREYLRMIVIPRVSKTLVHRNLPVKSGNKNRAHVPELGRIAVHQQDQDGWVTYHSVWLDGAEQDLNFTVFKPTRLNNQRGRIKIALRPGCTSRDLHPI